MKPVLGTAARLLAYLAALAVVFGVAWGVGVWVGGPAPAASSSGGMSGMSSTDAGSGNTDDMDGMDMGGSAPATDAAAPITAAGSDSAGLTTTSAGYTLVAPTRTVTPGVAGEFAFTITGIDGRPVTQFDDHHGRQMHLVVVRRDGTLLQHLFPARDATGTWRVPLTLPAAGAYRAFADFVPSGGPALVLGVDLLAGGDFTPAQPAPSRVAQVDGYTVRLDGELVAGSPSQVFATISRDGAPVLDLQPYLGAFGHLVALREEDFSYVHVEPDHGAKEPGPEDRAGPGVAFTASVSAAGTYRLFLEFRAGDAVHTADFTVATRTP